MGSDDEATTTMRVEDVSRPPLQPKRPKTARDLFRMSNRHAAKKANPSLKTPALGKLLNKMWEDLPADEKQKLEDQYQERLAKYRTDMISYEVQKRMFEDRKAIQAKVEEQKREEAQVKKNEDDSGRPVPVEKPKRPLNGYSLWLEDNRDSLKKKLPPKGNIIQYAAQVWPTVSDKVKQKYTKKYEKLNEAYQEKAAEYEAYLYAERMWNMKKAIERAKAQ